MGKVIDFVPRRDLEAHENVAAFIASVKDLDIFKNRFVFEKDQWDGAGLIDQRGKTGAANVTFSTFDSCGSRTKWSPMAEPFLSFAKAKIGYDLGLRKKENHNMKMAAYRALEKALIRCTADGEPRVENVNMHVLNLAASMLEEANPASCYQSGCHLEIISDWIVKKQMTKVSFQWKNIISKQASILTKISKEADEYRLQNIPSIAALKAMPQIYNNSYDKRDTLITSLVAVMFSSPDRFNEVFALPERCEVDAYDATEKYGLIWDTSKRGERAINWIGGPMKDVCKEAIENIRKVTLGARAMARWYEAHPTQLYLPEGFEYLREQEYVRSEELVELLGKANKNKVCTWAANNGLSAVEVANGKKIGRNTHAYRFGDVERIVCGMLPKGFPVYDRRTGLTYGKALLLVPKNFFHQTRGTWRCMFEAVDINTFNDQLGQGAKFDKGSIFSRNKFTEEDGSAIKVNSNDFKHYLSYLAKTNGVTSLLLALWSRRRRVAENKTYGDPITPIKTQLLREAGVDVVENRGLMKVEVSDPECPGMLLDIKEILELQHKYVHETRFGYCAHDYTTPPCERRMQCLECTRHLCIKGLPEKTERIRKELESAERTLLLVEEAIADSSLEAEAKLHKYSRKRLLLLKELVTMFDDPTITVGTKITFNSGAAATPLEIAIKNRVALGGSDGELFAATASRTAIGASHLMDGPAIVV